MLINVNTANLAYEKCLHKNIDVNTANLAYMNNVSIKHLTMQNHTDGTSGN